MATLTLAAPDAKARPMLLGLSGGLDSTALLYLLAEGGFSLRALHVHHGLQPDADLWLAHCQNACDALGVTLHVARVEVTRRGDGLEAAARNARHAAFAEHLRDGETLVLAHHRDDQAETLLLRLMRASGSGGLAAMRPRRKFGRGELWRPLLDIPRADLLAYARDKGLAWIEDPSNNDESLDRNFLRLRVLPVLAERWPHAAAAMARSASLLAEDARLLDDETAKRLAQVQGVDPATLSATALLALDPAWRHRVVRAWIVGLALPPLPGAALACIDGQMLPARGDAEPEYHWAGCVMRRWRDLLHAGPARAMLPEGWQMPWSGESPLPLPTGDGLALVQLGISQPDPEEFPGVRVRARHGGERITLPGRDHTHALKKALQDHDVPSWERKRLPMLLAGDGELLAAGDLLISARLADWSRRTGRHLRWSKT